jgi:hypothetical protein
MADETPRRPAVPEPVSDAKKHANKLVVLSSVAKPAQSEDESLLGEPDPSRGTPSLPPKSGESGLIHPVGWTTRPGGTTTIIKLPPKTGVLPRLTSLSPKGRQQPPPLPQKAPPVVGGDEIKRPPQSKVAPKDGGDAVKRSAPIKVAPPVLAAPTSEQESIFASASAPPLQITPPRRVAPPPLPMRMDKKSPAPLNNPALLAKSQPPVVAATPAPTAHHVVHVPPLVAHDSPAPESELPAPGQKAPVASAQAEETALKADPLAQTAKLMPPPALNRPSLVEPAQALLPLPGTSRESAPPPNQIKGFDGESKKHRLPPRSSATGRLTKPAAPESPTVVVENAAPVVTPPKVFPVTPAAPPVQPAPPVPAAIKPQAVRSTVTPPTIPLKPGTGMVKPPTIPLNPAPTYLPFSPLNRSARPVPSAALEEDEDLVAAVPSSRSVRMRKRRLIGIIVFYVLLVALIPCLYFAALYVSQETRVEGQVIPPPGMLLGDEVWIVTDFRELATGIASDLASNRMIVVQDMQERLGHVQRAQADVATREARIRLFKDQIQADNDEEMSLVKQARDAAQQVWDGPGAQLETDYQTRLSTLNQAIADRARANHLQYNPDPNYYSPEVWANAYRLALYQVPAGVDSIKERAWLDDQMKAWHDFTKSMDQKQNDLRSQAVQLKLAPASKVADLKSQIDDLQQRIDGTIAEEEPLKAELEQARSDLAASQAKEAGLDAKPYEQLDALPEQNITKRLPLLSNGRFSWREVEKESKYGEGEKSHVFWIFARALRSDGRQYWALHRFNVDKNSTTLMMIEPESFVSTRAVLRPDLSPDEQAQ